MKFYVKSLGFVLIIIFSFFVSIDVLAVTSDSAGVSGQGVLNEDYLGPSYDDVNDGGQGGNILNTTDLQSGASGGGSSNTQTTNAGTQGTSQTTNAGTQGTSQTSNAGTQGAGTKTSSSSFSLTIKNPLKADSLQCLLYDIVNGVVGIMAIVAALYIIYSGFLFIAAQGNPAELTKAKTAFFNAVIGTAILLGAWAITAFVVNVISSVVEDPSKLPDVSSISC